MCNDGTCKECCSDAHCPKKGDKNGTCNGGSCKYTCGNGLQDCGNNTCKSCCDGAKQKCIGTCKNEGTETCSNEKWINCTASDDQCKGGSGQPCRSDNTCDIGLYCGLVTCQPLKGTGESCLESVGGRACRSGICVGPPGEPHVCG
jgi:hypothetical protein